MRKEEVMYAYIGKTSNRNLKCMNNKSNSFYERYSTFHYTPFDNNWCNGALLSIDVVVLSSGLLFLFFISTSQGSKYGGVSFKRWPPSLPSLGTLPRQHKAGRWSACHVHRAASKPRGVLWWRCCDKTRHPSGSALLCLWFRPLPPSPPSVHLLTSVEKNRRFRKEALKPNSINNHPITYIKSENRMGNTINRRQSMMLLH